MWRKTGADRGGYVRGCGNNALNDVLPLGEVGGGCDVAIQYRLGVCLVPASDPVVHLLVQLLYRLPGISVGQTKYLFSIYYDKQYSGFP